MCWHRLAGSGSSRIDHKTHDIPFACDAGSVILDEAAPFAPWVRCCEIVGALSFVTRCYSSVCKVLK